MRAQDTMEKNKMFHFDHEIPEIPSGNISSGWSQVNNSEDESTSQPYWWDGASAAPDGDEDFVSVLPTEYEDNRTLSRTKKATTSSTSFFPVQMVLSWLPPKPPTAFDGFHIHIEREGKFQDFIFITVHSITVCRCTAVSLSIHLFLSTWLFFQILAIFNSYARNIEVQNNHSVEIK